MPEVETHNKKILVVDDSLTIRMQVKELLEENDYRVILAKDGEDCLEILKDKTVGNLDDTEDKLLDDILYNLRLKYIQHAKAE